MDLSQAPAFVAAKMAQLSDARATAATRADELTAQISHLRDRLNGRVQRADDDPLKPGQPLWPPPQPLVPPELLAAIRPDPFLVHEAAKGTYIAERNRRVLEDNRRQIAEAEQRQREREEREAAEIEAAKERDRQAYRERGWPSG